MSKASRAKKRGQKRHARPQSVKVSAPQPHSVPARKAVRPTPERIAQGGIVLPRDRSEPARVAVPDCVAALCINPRRLTQEQENAARAYQEMRGRVLADIGAIGLRSCLDISPAGYDDGDGDVALAREWRQIADRLGPNRIRVLDRTCREGAWPRNLSEFQEALEVFYRC